MDEDKKKVFKLLLQANVELCQLSKEETLSIVNEVFEEMLYSKSRKPEICDSVNVGWYAFEGGKFSPNPDAYPNLQGVVAWCNPNLDAPKGQRGLIITPEQQSLLWGERYCKTGIGGKEDGSVNTKEILAYGHAHKIKFPAAEWCANYSKHGIKPGEGFLPAEEQLLMIAANSKVINVALRKIRGATLEGCCWSASEHGYGSAWFVYIGYKGINSRYGNAYYLYFVRCCLAF